MELNTTATRPEVATMDSRTFSALAHALQTAAVAFLIFAVITYVPKLKQRAQLAKLPTISSEDYVKRARSIYIEGYQKFKDCVYKVTTLDGIDNVVVPLKLLPELRRLPDDILSFPKAIDNLMEVKYTQLLTDAPTLNHTIKSDLTPALSRLNPIICAEVDECIKEELSSCKDWTEVDINNKLIDIVARVSGRVFVGPELCKDAEYLACGRNYTVYLVGLVNAIKRVRPWLRPFLVPRLPEYKQLRDVEKRAERLLRPLVRGRMEAEKNDSNWEKPNDVLQWLLNRSIEFGEVSVESIATTQLALIFAAIHTTSMTATNILYTLAVTPEYIEPLREEVSNAMAEEGGNITTKALGEMVKLDSYMKEVFRVYPPGITSFGRHVLKGITLSNGQYIPPGVIIEVPAQAIYADSAHYPESATFDGYRHYKLRQGGTATDHARNQFVTSNESNLAFGYGRHACPGRFFAANEIKMILARLLLDYEFKNPGDKMERHEQFDLGTATMPMPGATLMFRKVER